MIVVSFYTNDVYMKHAAELKRSCEAFGIPCEIDQLPHSDSWQKNVLQKPAFMRAKMEKHPKEDIVWLDADSIVRERPELLLKAEGCDVAGFQARYRGDLWGSTLLFKPTDAAREVVANWQLRVDAKPGWPDHLALKFAASIDTPAARLLSLPATYTWTEWIMRSWDLKAKPIIEHLGVAAKKRGEDRSGETAPPPMKR